MDSSRKKLPPFRYARPASVEEAVRLLAESRGDAKIIAGGQTLLPLMAFRLAAPSLLVDIGRIPELKTIRVVDGSVILGAGVRWCEILNDPRLATAHPLLTAAISHVAHYQIRNRGTVGGSLAHADNAAEMLGIAVACDAEIAIAGPTGLRTLGADDFVLGPLTTALADDEVIVEIRLPAWTATRRWEFMEFARRRGDFALAAIALHYDKNIHGRLNDVHLAVIGACNRPMRAAAAEALLEGELPSPGSIAAAAAAAADAVDLNDDVHASTAYRQSLVATLVERCFESAETRAT